MATGNSYFDELRNKPEVIDPPQNDDMMDVIEHVTDPAQTTVKPNVTVSSSVRELLECPVCLNAMYPPIHQVHKTALHEKPFLCHYLFSILLKKNAYFGQVHS